MKKILVILSQSPFNTNKAREGQDLLLALAAVEHQVSVLYCGAGVLQLRQNGTLPIKDFTVQQKLFDLYDIDAVYACAHSLNQWAVDSSQLKTRALVMDLQHLDLGQFDFVVEC